MLRRYSLHFAWIGLILLSAASLAQAAGRHEASRPHRYLGNGQDGRLVLASNPVDATTVWSAWAYRNGAEFDLALSTSNDGGAVWSEPILIGLDDGIDQADPAVVVDRNGTVFVAYAQGSPKQVMLTWRTAGATEFRAPMALTQPLERAGQPALRMIGDRLAVAVQGRSGIRILDFALENNGTLGFTDGPDPVGSAGDGEDDDEEEEDDNDSDSMPFIDYDGEIGPMLPGRGGNG